MAKILHVHKSSLTPFNIVNTELLYCIRFQSNEQISQLIIQIPIQTATNDMYLTTTKYLCDHRNCTVEMIIGPMKNPVNHKQQGMLGTVQIQDVFCRKCMYKAIYYDILRSCLELFYTNKINSKLNKKTCRHTGVCPSFVHFSASKQTK